MVRCAAVVLACAGCAAMLAAQSPSATAPPRDNRPIVAAAPSPGDARIFGRVLDAETSRALRGALVVAVPERLEDGTVVTDVRAEGTQPFATRTDAEGRFVLSDLTPGEYALSARRTGYVQQQLGQASPTTPGRRLVVQRGADAGPLEFALMRSAVISGSVLDSTGLPAERVTVRAERLRNMHGVWRLQGEGQATTNDLGEFRVFGLPPGSYVLSAYPMHPSNPPGTSP